MLKKTKKSLTFKRLSKEKEQELIQRTRELETVYEIGALINDHSRNLDVVFPVILEKVASLTGYEMGAIVLLNEAGEVLEMKSQIGHSPAMLQEVKVLKFNEGVSGEAIRLKEPVTVSIREYPSPRIARILREEGVQTVVGIPLLGRGKAIGAIVLSTRSPRQLNQSEVNSLESVGNHIGIALESAELLSTIAKAKSEWETTFDAVTDLITILDKDYRMIRANEATFIRFGLKPKEMIGRKCFEILSHGDQPCEGCPVSETLKTKGRALRERNYKYLSGVFKHETFPIFGSEGEVVAVVDLAREITEEKRMQMEKEVVNHVNRILASSLDLKQGIRSVYDELKRVLDCERMTVTLFDEEEKGFRYFALEKDYEAGELVGDVLYPLQGTHFERMAERGEPEIIDNAEGDSWIGRKLLQEEGIRSTLIFPLEYKGTIIGAVNFGSSKPNHFSEAQFNLLRQIAPGLAISIQNVLLFRETQKRLEELTILHEITKVSTSASLTIDQMLREIEDNRDLFKSEYLDIFLIEENTKRLIHYTYDKSHRYNIDNIEALGLCLGKGITGWVAEKGEPLLVNDVTKDPRYVAGDESIRSEICVPLKVGQKVIGVIDAQSRGLNFFSQNDLRLLNIAAGQIASLIENSRLQDGIKRSEEKYRTVVESAIDGVCVIGKDHLFKYINERLAEIHGYRSEELIGADFRNLLDDESRTLLTDREDKRARGIKLPPHFELDFLHKEGGVRNAEISARAIKDSQGDVNIVAFVRDITDRKQAEVALRRSEEESKRLSQENAVIAEIGRIISSTLNIEEVYERFAEEVSKLIPFDRIAITTINPDQHSGTMAYVLGVEIKDRNQGNVLPLIGSFYEEIFSKRSGILVLTEDESELAERYPILLSTFRAGLRSMISVPLISKGQVIGVLHIRSLKPNAYTESDLELAERVGNQIAGAIANAQLFMESKQAEEKYRAIIGTAMDGFWMVDMEGHFWDVNDAYCRLIGYSRDELLTMRISDVEAEERPEDTARRIQKIMEVGGDRFETRHKCKDGRIINIEISVNYMEVSGGRMFVFLRDITERKRTEESLWKSEEEARRLSQENAVIAEIGRIISSTLNIEEVYARFADEVRKIISFDRISVNILNPDRASITIPYAFGVKVEDVPEGTILPLHALFIAKVISKRQGLLILMESESELAKSYPSLLKHFQTGFRSMMSVPLISKDQVIGILHLQSLKPKAYTESDVRLLERVGNQIAGAIANAHLFNERKRAEEALRQSEEKYRTILETMQDAYYEVDLAGNYTFVNNALCRNFGYTKEELIGMKSLQTQDEAKAKKTYDSFKEIYRTGEPVKALEVEYSRKDGTKGTYELSASLIRDAQGKPTGLRGITRDITERKQMEEALRESENKFRSLVENSIVGVYLIQEGIFKYVNARLAEIHGYEVEEMVGKMGPKQNIFPEDLPIVERNINKRLKGEEESIHYEFRIVTKSQEIRYVEVFGSRTMYQGRPAVIGTMLDITDRKKAEEALRQSEEKYRAIIENIQEAYFEDDLSGNLTFFNDVLCRHLGYTREELIGLNYRQRVDEKDARKLRQFYSELYRTGEPIKALEAEFVRKDGTKLIGEFSSSLIRDSAGKPIGFRGISRDITDRKKAEEALRQSEEKYRNILESIEDGYYEVDLAGNSTFFNDSLRRIYGYPKEEVMGMNYRRVTDQENAKKLFQTFNRVYRTGEPGRIFDWEIIRKDGTKRHVEASVSLQKDASGKAIGFKGILRDITEKKKVEEQLFQTEKLRAVGEMASGVAHDFNNALAAILGNTQLLLYTTQDEELKETLKIIEKVAKDSGQTVRRLQDFTKKRVDQELFNVDVNAIIKDSMEMTKPKWKDEPQSRGIRIEMVSNLEEIPSVSGNASELREVITNMIFNAIEAMPEGGKVEIHTFKEGGNVLIRISDTGTGISEETKKRIFEPFFTTKAFTNTGLGLSMSYGIIKRFGGEIEVESKLGQGTVFTIILPVGGEEKEEAASLQAVKKGRRALILVIDDDEFVRSVLSRTLAQADHQVTLAENGEKGIQIFKEGKFDIVLTDLGLPGMSGWEVCRMIKETSPQTPVGMITGWGVEKNRSEVEEYGLDFFISKPFDFNQILNVVSETMASKEE